MVPIYSRSGDELLESLGLFGEGGGLLSGAVRFVDFVVLGGERVTYGWLSDCWICTISADS